MLANRPSRPDPAIPAPHGMGSPLDSWIFRPQISAYLQAGVRQHIWLLQSVDCFSGSKARGN